MISERCLGRPCQPAMRLMSAGKDLQTVTPLLALALPAFSHINASHEPGSDDIAKCFTRVSSQCHSTARPSEVMIASTALGMASTLLRARTSPQCLVQSGQRVLALHARTAPVLWSCSPGLRGHQRTLSSQTGEREQIAQTVRALTKKSTRLSPSELRHAVAHLDINGRKIATKKIKLARRKMRKERREIDIESKGPLFGLPLPVLEDKARKKAEKRAQRAVKKAQKVAKRAARKARTTEESRSDSRSRLRTNATGPDTGSMKRYIRVSPFAPAVGIREVDGFVSWGAIPRNASSNFDETGHISGGKRALLSPTNRQQLTHASAEGVQALPRSCPAANHHPVKHNNMSENHSIFTTMQAGSFYKFAALNDAASSKEDSQRNPAMQRLPTKMTQSTSELQQKKKPYKKGFRVCRVKVDSSIGTPATPRRSSVPLEVRVNRYDRPSKIPANIRPAELDPAKSTTRSWRKSQKTSDTADPFVKTLHALRPSLAKTTEHASYQDREVEKPRGTRYITPRPNSPPGKPGVNSRG